MDAPALEPAPAVEPALALRGITKRFGAFTAVDAVDLTAASGEIVALLGENGAGKTTLMNVLFGHYRPDAGTVHVFAQELIDHGPDEALAAGVGMVHQHFTLAGAATVLDNVMLGSESLWQPFSRRTGARARLERLMAETGLTVPVDARIADLAVGERQRVEILKALYRDARVLILDEPTAVLTPQEVDALFEQLRRLARAGLAVIVISHKLHEVLAISDRVVVLRQGRRVGETRTAHTDRDALAELIVGRRIDRPDAGDSSPGEPRLVLERVTVASPERGPPLLDAVTLEVRRGQLVGLAGVSGNGQGVLAEVLSGLRPIASGRITLDGDPYAVGRADQLSARGVARIPEDRHRDGALGESSLWENFLIDGVGDGPAWRFGTVLDRARARRDATRLVDDYDIRTTGIEQPAGLLSGGNLQKLILARNLDRSPRLIIANQPTRGLDEGAIAAVHRLLLHARDAGAAILLISEDLDELLRLADPIVVMQAGRVSAPMRARDATARSLGLAMAGAA